MGGGGVVVRPGRRIQEDGRAGVEGTPRKTAGHSGNAGGGGDGMREDGRGWGRMGEDGRGWERTGENGRGWDGTGEDERGRVGQNLRKWRV